MGFLRGLFGSFESEGNTTDIQNDFAFDYIYFKNGLAYENLSSDEGEPFEFEVNVTIEFLWNGDKNMYEVEYYVSSPTVTDVDVPDYEKFKTDVYRDLCNKGINLDYIPDSLEWNM
ncbi:hypothetical protein [Planococcus halotolerans]|uniref:Uncharacterized protein n=1 Tax=Planococcus halotolerans TaxID=2233542 RepID=A0A365KX03_9BACL|nr:hypothetical protein [Planococcus halotolerans]QHJ72273.1 hypothetical protein DNR44_017425 [Planococcus halotolerans]RAZ77705.1 hypothetical protein DP120_09485 [Planococcus halotolerans]